MKGTAKSKYIRMSPRKIGLVLDQIRGKSADEAFVLLDFINKRAVSPVRKTLKSAVANAAALDKPESVKIVKAWVGQGPRLKRLKPRAMGRADILMKPTAHIQIEVE